MITKHLLDPQDAITMAKLRSMRQGSRGNHECLRLHGPIMVQQLCLTALNTLQGDIPVASFQLVTNKCFAVTAEALIDGFLELTINFAPAFVALAKHGFLKECYASSGALSQYALISREVLEARYSLIMQKELHVPTLQPARVKDGVTPELTAEITADAVSAGLKRRVIILLGDVGVGKSMFIRHLVRVDARSLFDKAISLYVDFGKPI